jgi:hypothetical protein
MSLLCCQEENGKKIYTALKNKKAGLRVGQSQVTGLRSQKKDLRSRDLPQRNLLSTVIK